MTLMVVFAWCCLSLPSAFAQDDIKITDNGTAVTPTLHTSNLTPIIDCDATGTRLFTDDGGEDGNYADATPRMDTVQICPKDAKHRIKVTFTDFDIAELDTLYAFDGNIDSVRLVPERIGIGSGSGVGVSKFCSTEIGTGAKVGTGWVTSSCSPITNPSGCITFIFDTDGTNSKGAGWKAQVECEERTFKLGDVDIDDVALTCTDGYGQVTVAAPPVLLCGDTVRDGKGVVIAKLRSATGEVCLEQKMSWNGVVGFDEADLFLGVGQYSIEFTWEFNPTVIETEYFAVTEPSLVCNDVVEAPLGAAGSIQFAPDDILENACDTISDIMYYNITVTLGTGKDTVVLRTENFDNSGPVVYPTITKDDIAAAKLDCGGTATVKIERIYYGLGFPTSLPLGSGDGACDNGVVSASCETTVVFKDQSDPVLILPTDLVSITACDIESVESVINSQIVPNVTANDNFDADVDVTVSVVLDESGPCFGDDDMAKAIVTFTATDDCENFTTRTAEYDVIRPSNLEKVGNFSVECDEDISIPVPSMTLGYTDGSGFHRTDSIQLNAIEALPSGTESAEYVCGYILLYTDEKISGTDCGDKYYRYYELIDWCDGAPNGDPERDTVYIEVTDTKAPFFVNDVDQVTAPVDIPLGSFACTYDINNHAKPAADDECGLDEVILHKVFRIEGGQNWEIEDKADWAKLDCDSFRLMYIATDLCHEQPLQDTTRQIVVIKDVTPPVAAAVDQLNVSVPNDEGALVLVGAIDNGSNDNCEIVSREIRRRDLRHGPDWGPSVVIDCEDVHEEVEVELRVIDKQGNMTMTGTNSSWTVIKAEDKIPPVCGVLNDTTITCKDIVTGELGLDTKGEWVSMTEDDELWDAYKRFGNPATVCMDNLSCGTLTFAQEYQVTELDCGQLIAKRRYGVSDWVGSDGTGSLFSGWTEQTIIVEYVPEWTLEFPEDLDLTVNCGDEASIPEPLSPSDVILNGSCDLWALSLISEDTFVVGNDVCMRIERKYEVINWCRFNAGDTATPLEHNVNGVEVKHTDANVSNSYVYTHFINVTINDNPNLEFGDVDTRIIGVGDALPYNEEDKVLGAAPYECDDIRTFSASATNCIGVELTDVSWIMYVNGTFADGDSGSEFTWVVQPDYSYRVEFSASDGCGNSVSKDTTYVFKDFKKPTPYVYNGIAVDLGAGDSVVVWADDLDLGSFDNCTNQDDLEIYITIGELTDIVTDIDEIRALGSNATFTCDHVGRTNVLIYVVDASDNFDVVGTYVSVGGNAANCSGDPGGMVAGHIVTPFGEDVEQVVVSIAGDMQESMMTTADGTFQFELNAGDNYTITPVKDIRPLNGVSTFDLVLISKHILGK